MFRHEIQKLYNTRWSSFEIPIKQNEIEFILYTQNENELEYSYTERFMMRSSVLVTSTI